VAGYYTFFFAQKAYQTGEISSSSVGLTNVWIMKSFLLAMFVLLGLAGVSQLIKATAGFMGKLPAALVPLTIGGDLEITTDAGD
jgi:TRAP-type mannitol/chloroaromatic compound transport system permease small subunit